MQYFSALGLRRGIKNLDPHYAVMYINQVHRVDSNQKFIMIIRLGTQWHWERHVKRSANVFQI